jgi:hypothetical protein
VIHLFKDVDLPLKPLNSFGIINRLLLDELCSPLKARDLIDAAANLAVRALSKLLLDLVIVCEFATLLFHEA